MKSPNLVLIIAMVLCLTHGVTAQLPQAPPSQPVISLDFAQYCIGDFWKLKSSNGAPNTSMRLLGTSNGQSWEITDWRKTERRELQGRRDVHCRHWRQPHTEAGYRWNPVNHLTFCGFRT